jgi:putative toxin-antitoxin system antitoxin component (TIGR02293 family)
MTTTGNPLPGVKARKPVNVAEPMAAAARPDTGRVKPAIGQKAASRLMKGDIAAIATRDVVPRYSRRAGIDAFVRAVVDATPNELISIERAGVSGEMIKDLSARMNIPAVRMFAALGLPKATVEKKAAEGGVVKGSGGYAAVGMIKLLGIAQQIVANSTAPAAASFDSAKWLGRWIEIPQPALGGRKPAEMLDTPTGVEVVAKLLGAIESGAYQ